MASSTPTPKFPLTGHCSIIHEGTLYVYSPAGFQSLKFEEGAQWETLPMDVSLTGAQCVKAVPKGNAQAAKLFIVGGAVNETAAGWNYPGLMHYTFATKKWDWQRSETFATQNRQNHGAVYLQDAQKLFVYSGSQSTGDFGPSSQSFLISTVEPYSVEGLESKGAPPSVKPLLLQNDANSALLVGGGATNTAVWTYSIANGWNPMKVTLQQPITNQDAVQCAVINGDDGSKVLEKFDMSVSPNKVERILLLGKGGSDATPGESPSQQVKRVTISDWAAYNETFAPTSTRAGYSLAQGDDGVTVASGGNQQDPIVIFDAKENSWVNSTALFKGQEILRTSESSSTIAPTSTPTASSTPSATADPVAAVPPSNKGRMLTVLGATLGTIFGIAFILLLILFCIKYRKRKNKRNEGYVEKDRMSFADRGADFMKEAGGSPLPHHYNMNNASSSSLAIIGNGRPQQGHKKNMASDASQAPLVSKASPLGYSEPVELSKFDLKPVIVEEKIVRQNSGRAPPAKSAPRARSSGWSRYFANNDATNLANVDRSTYASERTSTASQSEYTSSDLAYRNNPAQHIAPLTIPRLGDGQRLSRVASGSPTMGTPNGTLPHQVQPMQAELGRANSNGSTRSGISHDDGYFRKPVDSWTPVGDDQYHDRRTSSQYTGSMIIEPNTGKYDVASSYYPDGADSIYAKSGYSSYYPGQTQSEIDSYPAPPRLGAAPQDRESTVTVFPGAVSQNTQSTTLPKPEFTPFFAPPRVGHESTVTVFPGPGDKKDNTNNDMSWLNLGTSR